MQLIDGDIPVYGDPIDPGALAQIRQCRADSRVWKVALMGDHHKGYNVPIGGVVAYEDAISPSGVGFDIGCGNKAVLTDARLPDIQPNLAALVDDIAARIAFGVGRANPTPPDHELFDDETWKERFAAPHKQLARHQLGSVGSGNHYVDLFADDADRIWIGVHFGSRGLGHRLATHFLRAAGASRDMDAPPCVLGARDPLGEDYLRAMKLAGRYAYAGRDWVCARVAAILGAEILDSVHNHHNYAWEEEHFGRKLWVVRKGATPAFPGQRGFAGGSMGDISVILEGVESPASREILCSTIHGAGRVMGRMEAKGKTRKGKVIREPRIHRADMERWIAAKGVILRGGDVDEAPQAYKRIEAVLAHHGDTIKVTTTLRPLGVCMA